MSYFGEFIESAETQKLDAIKQMIEHNLTSRSQNKNATTCLGVEIVKNRMQ